MLDIILWLIVGGLAGWIASIIMKTDSQMGIPANIGAGIVGALIGGFLMRMVTGESTDMFSIGGFIVAVLGAVILIALLKMLTGRPKSVQ